MWQDFLLPEAVIRDDGAGSVLYLERPQARLLLVTLSITRILEQQSLDLSIWGSPDRADWGQGPLASFPQKFYCGTYRMRLDLSGRRDVQYLQARWKVNRWGHWPDRPLFGAYVFVEEAEARAGADGVKGLWHVACGL